MFCLAMSYDVLNRETQISPQKNKKYIERNVPTGRCSEQRLVSARQPPEPSQWQCREAVDSLTGPSAADCEEGWNDGTLLHLPTRQPITRRAGFTSALATPRFLGDGNNWAYPKRGRLISPPCSRAGGAVCVAAAPNWFVWRRLGRSSNSFVMVGVVVFLSRREVHLDLSQVD